MFYGYQLLMPWKGFDSNSTLDWQSLAKGAWMELLAGNNLYDIIVRSDLAPHSIQRTIGFLAELPSNTHQLSGNWVAT
jgi:hypothetical protein